MTVIVKIDEGVVRKLAKQKSIELEEPKNLLGKERTLNVKSSDVTIQRTREGKQEFLEIADVNGSFGVWVPLNKEREERLKKISMGP